MKSDKAKPVRNAASAALAKCYPAFAVVALFSAAVNILMLTGSIYMLQVYDRVLASRSVPTLVALSAIVLAAYVFQGSLDALRVRMLARIGARFDELVSRQVCELSMELPLKGVRSSEAAQPVRDLDQIRTFLSGLGPTALFDMPFMPLFLAACFILHPWLGWLAVAGGVTLISLTLFGEVRSRNLNKAATESLADRQSLGESSRRNAEVICALGMQRTFSERFGSLNIRHVNNGLALSAVSGLSGVTAKSFRMILQSAGLGLGAYLVILGEMSAGSMIATSILMSRALAPIETAIANWRGFLGARQGFARLKDRLSGCANSSQKLKLPAPVKSLSVSDIYVGVPGTPKPIIQGISFELRAGDGLAVIGPSASGKSTLARGLCGIRPAMRGEVRLDGAALDQWGEDLGRHIGYLPQDVELFDGTVAQNIARFITDATAPEIIAAAQAAGAHEMILGLADGYETRIGEAGAVLSGGQRQRVALARALFRDPFFVVLDEPNASLDNEGDEALNQAMRSVRARGGILVVITHRPGALAAIDQVAIMTGGRIQTIGPREQVLQQVMKFKDQPIRRRQAS